MLSSVALYLCENVARCGFCGGFAKLNYKSYGLTGKLLIKMLQFFFLKNEKWLLDESMKNWGVVD